MDTFDEQVQSSEAPAPSEIGKKFGRLTVLALVHVSGAARKSRYDWRLRCDCGSEVVRRKSLVRSGHTKSCGCWAKERIGALRRRHGMSHLPAYLNWQTMIQRCENPRNPHYPRYGGRGITVCDRWKVFEHFYADMGERPTPTHSIDRRDNDKGYSPDNCRWATKREQLLNTRRSIAKRARLTGTTLERIIKPMAALPDFEREMKNEARNAPDKFIRERRLTMALLAKNLVDPVDNDHKARMVASLQHQARGLAHRQAQGGGQ